MKGTAAAKKGKAGLISLGTILSKTLATGLVILSTTLPIIYKSPW